MFSMRVALVAALALSLAWGSVAASPVDDKVLAKQHYESGARHFDLSEWDQALVEFKEAYRLKPDPTFLYNIAQCHRRLGHVGEALTFYKTYLRRAPDAPNREEVERRIQELESEQRAKVSREAEEEREAKTAQTAKVAAEAKVVAETKVVAEAQAAKTVEPLAILPSTRAETPEQLPAPPPRPRPLPDVSEVPATAPAVIPAPGTRVDLAQSEFSKPPGEAAAETSILHRWWFWSAIGGVVVTGVAVGLLAARGGGGGAFCADCANTSGVNLP
jgi:hypothetical protein